jgi:hypothetical protein
MARPHGGAAGGAARDGHSEGIARAPGTRAPSAKEDRPQPARLERLRDPRLHGDRADRDARDDRLEEEVLLQLLALELVHEEPLVDDVDEFLEKLSRQTWRYFETFVTDAENWLPPDNFQESPVARTAHRTSPTNIGLALLANLSAYDFGYITPGELIERTSNTMLTMHRMERYRGHFYNWYDTISLSPLIPKYISTVDSGNLAGHLLTLKQGLLSIPQQKIIAPRLFEGNPPSLCSPCRS